MQIFRKKWSAELLAIYTRDRKKLAIIWLLYQLLDDSESQIRAKSEIKFLDFEKLEKSRKKMGYLDFMIEFCTKIQIFGMPLGEHVSKQKTWSESFSIRSQLIDWVTWALTK